MVAELIAVTVVILAAGAELLHTRRCRRVAQLAFGPSGRPNPWVYSAPIWRVAALGALVWGLVTLMLVAPKVHQAEQLRDDEMRHLLLVLDVSPSMRLEDAGPTGKQSRIKRSADLLESFFQRTVIKQFWISVVAVYNGAKPVVVDTTDLEVVRNILDDLPMHYAFHVGETRLFDGLEEAARMARPWPPRSTTMLLVSDGDTVPSTGMPRMPASVSHVLIVGVGNSRTGSFIDGHHSRQDASTLRQIAVRLGGTYHDGNEKHIGTDTLKLISQTASAGALERLTLREYALLASAAGALVYAFLPLLLHAAGTRYRPGVPVRYTSQGTERGKVGGTGGKKLAPQTAEALS